MIQANDSVYLVATIPPPPGESDVYSAATRVQQGPLTGMAALLQDGEVAAEDLELLAALRPAPLLRVAGPLPVADNDHGTVGVTNSAGTMREWLVVAGLAVAGASAVFALSLAF